MRFAFAEDQEELRRSVRRVLDAHGGPGRGREPAIIAAGRDAALWKRLAGDLGLAGLIVPEAHGGAGLGWVELVGVMEELGRGLAAVPYLSTVLATSVIVAAGDDAQRGQLLPDIASGAVTATVAYLEDAALGDGPDAITATVEPDGDGAVLRGTKRHVLDGHAADLLVVAVRVPGSRGADGVELYAVAGDHPGVQRRRLATLDQTRPVAETVLDDVRVPANARLAGGWPALAHALALGSIALAAEQVGAAQRCLDMSVEYAKVRTQFGRPIGSFQAIQHRCADMFVLVESARSAAYYAGWAAAHEPPESGELQVAASIAKAYCSDAFYQCAADTIQVHGGIGFTWEHDAHLFFKRARASRDLLGTPREHRERLAGPIGLDDAVDGELALDQAGG